VFLVNLCCSKKHIFASKGLEKGQTVKWQRTISQNLHYFLHGAYSLFHTPSKDSGHHYSREFISFFHTMHLAGGSLSAQDLSDQLSNTGVQLTTWLDLEPVVLARRCRRHIYILYYFLAFELVPTVPARSALSFLSCQVISYF